VISYSHCGALPSSVSSVGHGARDLKGYFKILKAVATAY
jgi:hypothetical protein